MQKTVGGLLVGAVFFALHTVSSAMAVSDCAVYGCGVLGTSLCKQLIESSEFSSWKGMTS